MKTIGRWISIHRWDIFAYGVVILPLIWLAQFPLYVIWHTSHYHAVATRLAKATPNDWKELAGACQMRIEQYRRLGAKATESQPLPPSLDALAPAYTGYHKEVNRFECGWTCGFDNAELMLVFEGGKLSLVADQIPEIQLAEAKTQMWPVAPIENADRKDAR